ncbi:MAG: class I SAM-dependent methyltransferase [Luteimonas sp.]
MSFQDHFSAVAEDYAQSRPAYPAALFEWIASIAPERSRAWEAGCGSGQATRSLAEHFRSVHATDPSREQVAQAPALANVRFEVEAGERCSLPDASVDAICVAQALHWFDRDAFFAECGRVLRPGGVLAAWGYQDLVPPPALAGSVAAFAGEIADDWPPERALVDEAYAGFEWPFEAIKTPTFDMVVDWPLARLLGYFASYSATRRYRERTGHDPVARHARALQAAWGEHETVQRLRWPLFVHARRKPGG